MKHARRSGRFLAALLALLMALSTVIALPVVAEESGESGAEPEVAPLWSLDMSGGAKSVEETDAWLLANNGWGASSVGSANNYGYGPSKVKNVIDADGFYKIVTASSGIDGNARGETAVPTDFFKLFYGLYPGFDKVGDTYDWEFDFRLDSDQAYTRSSGKNSTVKYTASDGTVYETLTTTESGWSFFAARASGNYESIFRVARVNGKTIFSPRALRSVQQDAILTALEIFSLRLPMVRSYT